MHRLLDVARNLAHTLADTGRSLLTHLASAWRHHKDLMDENGTYRNQIYLGVTTILTALQIHPTLALLATVALALYVAAHDDGHWQPRTSAPRRPWGEEQW